MKVTAVETHDVRFPTSRELDGSDAMNPDPDYSAAYVVLHGRPVCPHAGGVGLCELVQHLSMFDYVAVSASLTDRVIEYVDHLHEHFVDPVVISRGAYRAPTAPGFSARMRPESLARFAFPDGPARV